MKHNDLLLLLVVLGLQWCFQPVAAQVPANVPVSGLVGWYPFNGNADDQSGNHHDGKIYFAQFAQDRFGTLNAAVAFNGFNAYIDSNIDTLQARGLTLSCWFSTTSVSQELQGLVVARNPGNGATGLYLLNGQDYIQQISNCSNDEKLAYRDSLFATGKWHHFAATFDGVFLRNYVDGRLVAMDSINMDLCINDSFEFGRDACCTKNYFSGSIDDIGIWSRALSEDEIRNLWLPAPPVFSCLPDYVPVKGLVGYWPFCGNTYDESGNGHHGVSGNNQYVQDRKGVSNAALNFDGVDDYVEVPHYQELNALPITVSFWMKAKPGTGTGKIMEKYCCSNWNGWNFEVVSNSGSSGEIHFEYLRGTCLGIFQTYCSSVPYPKFTVFDNAWHHFTFTLDSVQAIVYVDSKIAFTQKWIGNPSAVTNTLPLNFGRYGTGNSNQFTGQLDDIGIWKRALTAQEVADLYYGENPAYCSGTGILNDLKSYGTVADIDGNVYPTIKIASQEWMAQNLRAERYNDGTPIKGMPDAATWSIATFGYWTAYALDTTELCPYGALYNGYVATDVKNVCPTGWHVSTDQDWSLLVNTLGGPTNALGQLKVPGTDYWVAPNAGASNASGFSALPGGLTNTDGSFDYAGLDALFWTSTQSSGQQAFSRGLRQSVTNQIIKSSDDKRYGYSIRCVKDQCTPVALTQTYAVCANDFPFISGGNTFQGPGTYSDTISGVACDTILNYIIIRLPFETTTVTREVCANDFPLVFGGHIFTGPGALRDTIGGTGCDTIRTIIVNALPLETTTITRDVCANDFPYLFDGHIFTGPGILVDTANAAAGCDTIRTIIINSLPLDTISLTLQVCDNQFPYTFNGNIYNGPGIYLDEIPGAGCDTILVLTIQSLPSDNASAISVTTLPVTGIALTSALGGGVITGNGCAAVVQKGVIWSTTPLPTIALMTKTGQGPGLGTFASQIQPLLPNTQYYVRAYATNNAGVVYGNTVTFTTPPTPGPVLTFYMDTLAAFSSTEVVVPVKVKNFQQLISAQFTLKFNPTVLTFLGIEQAGLDSLGQGSFGFGQVSSGIIGFAWSQPNLQPASRPDGHVIFALRFRVSGAGGSSSAVRFDDDPVVIEFVNGAFTVVNPYNLYPGRVDVLQDLQLSGRLKTETGAGVRSATVVVSNAATTIGMQTPLNGQFGFALPPAQYTLTPTKNNDTVVTNGVTTFDGLLMQRHILGVQALVSPYKIIAADVNRNALVTTFDLYLVNSLILGNISGYPGGPLWTFVPDDYIFPNPSNPFPYPLTRTYSNLTTVTDQDFIGMKLGDVNNSYNPAVARMEKAGTVRFAIGSTEEKEKSRIKVPVRVSQFTNVAAFQFSVQWDANVLRYAGVEDNGGIWTLNTGELLASKGQLNVNWIHPDGMGATLSDDAVLFYLIFDVTGNAGISSTINLFSSVTTPIEIVSGDLKVLDFDVEKGTVTVGSSSGTDQGSIAGLVVKASPNPFVGQPVLQLTSDRPRVLQATILEMSGKVLSSEIISIDTGVQQRTMERILPQGMYLLQLTDMADSRAHVQLKLISN